MSVHLFDVRFTPAAEEDLFRLTAFLIERAQDLDDLSRVEASVSMLREAVHQQLPAVPWSFRKAGKGDRTTRRELVVPAGASGYVVLYEIESASRVQVLAVRHQLEQDYH